MCIIEFNIIINYILVFQNKCTYILTSFAYYMTSMIPQMYYMISLNFSANGHKDLYICQIFDVLGKRIKFSFVRFKISILRS